MEIFNILEEKWDVAILLDACRYDSFASIYQEYLPKGKLEKKIGASCTTRWLNSIFQDTYPEIVYVSGNPWINSVTSEGRFDARGKFGAIFDVWEWGWDEDYETVPPREVTKAAMMANEEHPEKKVIVHYLQPHYPYLTDKIPREVKMHFEGVDGRDGRAQNLVSDLSIFINEGLEQMLGRSRFWKIREFLELETDYIEEYLWRTYTPDQLQEFYEDNLRLVLSEVEELLDCLDGRVVVTSDHGEAFGENGDFFHPLGTKNPAVREIPYCKFEF
ncbi:hypothetical protein AKJ50_00035 [candidate division MSBL1 archaeon SCGC-AAA382A13]|uniref:Sulfatase N-terminal domain-containing protein n=1 Tax=candidate division MSBL1 archaeon SCGC-AAA382A13 TaxID=1698279 RepID=A0A133VH19_9EURY|nr:hypothetical protein AKJ50_00035 [candidate division MSBL1 archaeon SCGC-AAA382A13]